MLILLRSSSGLDRKQTYKQQKWQNTVHLLLSETFGISETSEVFKTSEV
jgi:hypothetical protein